MDESLLPSPRSEFQGAQKLADCNLPSGRGYYNSTAFKQTGSGIIGLAQSRRF